MKHATLDKIGFGAAVLCSIHCMILPLVISLLPLIGLGWFADETAERVFLTISALLAIFSICYGVHKHRKMHVLAILAGGIALMVVGHMSEGSVWGVCIAVAGGLSIATSHFLNHRLCTSCHSCEGAC